MPAAIRATRLCLTPGDPPPTFELATGGRSHFSVEVATNNILFNGANRSRRSRTNFFSSRQGQPALGVAGRELTASAGRATSYTLPPAVWRQFRTQPRLHYRVIAFDLHAGRPRRLLYSTEDRHWGWSPSLRIQTRPIVRHYTRPATVASSLPWLKVEGNKLVKRGTSDPVVLRGVNFSGLHYRQPGWRTPAGRRSTNWRQAAGITGARIQEIARVWKAQIIRLPLNQDWVLRGVGAFSNQQYLQDIDEIIGWAANEGMYTLLDLQNLDGHPNPPYGRFRNGRKNYIAPMPDSLSLRFWRILASRYRHEPAVLYDIYNEPHQPIVDPNNPWRNDTRYPRHLRPATDLGWIRMWHEWVRKIQAVIHCVHPDAVLFIAGLDWALDLRSMPVPLPGGTYVPNAVYSTHIYYHGPGHPRPTDRQQDWSRWLGDRQPPKRPLRLDYPIFIGEWGGEATRLHWGDRLETYFRTLHRWSGGQWQGFAGWTAWSWGNSPHLVERQRINLPSGGSYWNYVVIGGRHEPTEFGELVMCALSKLDTQADTGFNPAGTPGHRCPP